MAIATRAKTAQTPLDGRIQVKALNQQYAIFPIHGTAPLVTLAFSQKALNAMREKQAEGSTARKGKQKEARDFDGDFIRAQHVSTEGWPGIPASAFRAALIRACSLVGFQMTTAKMSIFVQPDGFEGTDGTPLVKILSANPPEQVEHAVRNATGVADIRVRPMWREWGAIVRVSYDGDQFTLEDVANLLERAGVQVGIGEGRPFSKMSAGMGWGTFEIDRSTLQG